jgi:lipopolysaccharide transport system ATP-binding protein
LRGAVIGGFKRREKGFPMSFDSERFTDVGIRVDGLSKVYEIYEQPQDRLKQYIYPRLANIFGRVARSYCRDFWALRDVSFELKKGQAIGIIGRNGSGKSTLLQIICGTLGPSGGVIETQGRVAALLELGSGFNPEFTGRENVYMNAMILGMTSEEIDSRFEDIEAFADIGTFIEQPVKTYSSGMMLRLAFAVIAHVDADILVVDEALAVGDAVFSQKCMRFIRSFQEQGALLFVSHDMGAVQNICETSIWLADGRVMKSGPSKDVAEAYLKYTLQESYGDGSVLESTNLEKTLTSDSHEHAEVRPPSIIAYEARMHVLDNREAASGWKTGAAEILDVNLIHQSSGLGGVFEGGEDVRMVITAKTRQDLFNPILGFIVKDRLGQDLFGENTLSATSIEPREVKADQQFNAKFDFRLPMLPNGEYVVMVSVADGTLQDNIQLHLLHDALVINVSSSKVRWGLVGAHFDRVVLEV